MTIFLDSRRAASRFLRPIHCLNGVAQALGLDFFLVGAMARDLLLEQHNIHAGRETEDVDLAVSVESWEAYQQLRDALLATGRFVAAGDLQRVRFPEVPAVNGGLPVDIVPFGTIQTPAGEISWPPRHEKTMTMRGFREAHAHSVVVQPHGHPPFRIASLPSLAMLKLIAWSDRRADKDGYDLATILTTYPSAGNEDRLFDEHIEIVDARDGDLMLAGAQLLGADIAAIAAEATFSLLREILAQEVGPASSLRLTASVAKRLYEDEPEDRANALLAAVLDGLGMR